MRLLRRQLMDLLEEARRQQGLELFPLRLRAALVHDTLSLLPHPSEPGEPVARIALAARTITHDTLHRHLVTIRCPDQAFYLDAIKGYLHRRDIQPITQQTMVAAMHCDEVSCDIQLRHPDQQSDENFMFIAVHLSATLVPDRDGVATEMQAILQAVDMSVVDFIPMRQGLAEIANALRNDSPEGAELLDWMNQDRYIFYGFRHDHARFGLMRNYPAMEHIVPGLRRQLDTVPIPETPGIDWLHLTAAQHHIYAKASIEVLRLCWRKEQQLQNAVLIGHFSRSARYTNASQLPLFREHWDMLQKRGLLSRSAFYRREVRGLYDRMPKAILRPIAPNDWLEPLKRIVDMTNPTQTVTALLTPAYGNLSYLLIAMSGRRYGPNIHHHLETAMHHHDIAIHGHESWGIAPNQLTLFAIEPPETLDAQAVAHDIGQCVIFWKDRARSLLVQHAKEIDLPAALKELEQLPPLYQELFQPEQFLADIRARVEALQDGRTRVRVRLQHQEAEIHVISCRPIALGELVDTIQAFGLKALQEAVVDFGSNGKAVRISCLRCHCPATLREEDGGRLEHALAQVFNEEAAHDRINALLIRTGLDIDQIAVLAALRNHLIQLLPDAAPLSLSNTLKRYPAAAERLLRLFAARHLPAAHESALAEARHEFEEALADVQNLTDDRWFRALAELVDAGLRTNAFVRRAGTPLAIKIDPGRLSFAPHPKPYREIFVSGVHVEGVHLRGGPIARGGIRFSDRTADFRTEVLELMATQVVKNGQIVPTGAKGGFIVRGGSEPDFILKQYRSFIRALLELTDNLSHGQALPPPGIRIPPEDQNDPYLVVAADKGTSRYSDDANEEARLAGFWLDDAFASGGKNGYDHKKVGITARGAWVCAAHHFARLGVDATRDPIRVVGIGDMSGDVFGNGMLLNPNMQLVGAFNHRHIFLDPDPDPALAFAERQRLFAIGGGWDQYKSSLTSKGGGVFDRTAKAIPIRPGVRKVLDIESETLSGEALIRALLKAPVDLLYNGGIGTYVKASAETHAEVQDPANNSVRIDAAQLQAKVVVEGGNLGFTQRGRIEYAAGGGIINTDAIDNSAGVDMSDHEVNLKILFSAPEQQRISDRQRNTALHRMTEAVTEQCLRNNLLQSRAVTLAAMSAVEHPPRTQWLRDILISEKRLDPENDPGMDDDSLLPLRPQLSVMLGHEKNRLHDTLEREAFNAHSCFAEQLLLDYFPTAIRRHHADDARHHPLAAGIIHTAAANHIVNHFGLATAHYLETLLDQPVGRIAQGMLLAEALMDAGALREDIWQGVTNTETVLALQREIQEYLMQFAEELLRLCPVAELDLGWIGHQQQILRRFRKSAHAQGLGGRENSDYLETLKHASQQGLDRDQAAHLATMPILSQMAVAIHLHSRLEVPANHCIRALQSCLHLLPFDILEQRLRSPDWGGPEAHELRKEWLHRLTQLKSLASEQLLQSGEDSMIKAGEMRWSAHRHWHKLQELRNPEVFLHEETTDEPGHMRLILALTHLESVIEES